MNKYKINKLEWSLTEYGIVGKRRGETVWWSGNTGYIWNNRPMWTKDDGWTRLSTEYSKAYEELKLAQEYAKKYRVTDLAIVKLVTKSKQTAKYLQ